MYFNSYGKLVPDNYLAHHGIKGQQWGVRNGPPYPLDSGDYSAREVRYGGQKAARPASKRIKDVNDLNRKVMARGYRPEILRQAHTIPVGTKLYRTTTDPNEKVRSGIYVTYLDSDRFLYKGGWVRTNRNSDKAYELSYRVNKDLNVPSRDELRQVINKIVGENRAMQKETIESWFRMAFPPGTLDWKEAGYDKKSVYKKAVREAIKVYQGMTLDEAYYHAALTLGGNPKLKKLVGKELVKRGYNAMTDEAGVGGQIGWAREGSDPLIVFDSSAIEMLDASEISRTAEKKADRDYGRWKRNKVDKSKTAAWSDLL